MQGFFQKKKKQEKQLGIKQTVDKQQPNFLIEKLQKLWMKNSDQENSDKIGKLSSSYTHYIKHSKKKQYQKLEQYQNKQNQSTPMGNQKNVYEEITLDLQNMHKKNRQKRINDSQDQPKDKQNMIDNDQVQHENKQTSLEQKNKEILRYILMKKNQTDFGKTKKIQITNQDNISVPNKNRLSSNTSNSNNTKNTYNSNSNKQKWVKVDNKVTIVNGKLVYSKSKQPVIQSQAQLIEFLHKNGVKLKEYIYGDKVEIVKKIVENYEKKEKQEIQKYINKNMKDEQAVEVTKTAWYEHAKEYLFD